MKVDISMPSLDDISVNGESFKEMSVAEMQRRIESGIVKNYAQLKGWVVSGKGPDICSFMARRTSDEYDTSVPVLDLQSTYDTANFGHGHPAITGAVIKLLESGFPTVSRAQDHVLVPPLEKALRDLTGLDRSYLCSTGTRGAEAALDFAIRYWSAKDAKKWDGTDVRWDDTRIVSAIGGLHGRSRTSRALAHEESSRTNFGPLMRSVEHVPYGDIDAMDEVFKTYKSDVIAVILEPVLGMNGCIVPPAGYLERVSQLCKKYDAAFILDEVRTGFGRTGTHWAYEQSGVLPDLVVFGKSAGGGIIPVAGVVGRDDIMSCVEPGGMLFDTWSGMPIQCVALLATIKLLCDEDIARASAEKSEAFFDEIKGRYPDEVVAIRGLGMFRSVQTRFPTETLRKALVEEGAWTMGLKAIPNAIFVSPPLVITDKQLGSALDALGRAFKRAA